MQGRSLIAVVGADNKVTIRPVQAVERFGPSWVITGDLKAGDRVVAEGLERVRDGTLVTPVPFAAKPAVAERLGAQGRRRSRNFHGAANTRPPLTYGKILHQPPDRGDGDLHPHGAHGPGGDVPPARSPSSPTSPTRKSR